MRKVGNSGKEEGKPRDKQKNEEKGKKGRWRGGGHYQIPVDKQQISMCASCQLQIEVKKEHLAGLYSKKKEENIDKIIDKGVLTGSG